MIRQQSASSAVAALQNLLKQQIPFLNGYYPYRDGRDLRHAPRLQFEAGPRKQTSHLAGLALDIFLASQAPGQRILAHHLIAAFVTHSAQMGWSQIIYERSNFVRRGSCVQHRIYTHDQDHFSHIHIDWWQANAIRGEEVHIPARAGNGGFGQPMRADLAEVNRNWNGNLLAPLNLSIDVFGLSAMHNVGR